MTGVELDFPALMAAVRGTVQDIHRHKRYEERLREAGVEVYRSRAGARFVSPTQVAVDEEALEGRKFLICTGGHARSLTFPGSDQALGHKELWGLEALPASLCVVGGSATGCQVASILAGFGVQVTVLEVADRLVAVEDDAVCAAVRARFEERGIRVVTGMGGVTSFDGSRVVYSGGEVECEALFLAVGWVGNTDALDLACAGVETAQSYVVVNEHLQSTAEHIYAAGDVTGRMMLTQSAKVQADLALDNLVDGNRRVYHPLLVAQGGYTDPEYAGVGLTEREAEDYEVEVVGFEEMARPVIDHRATGFFKLLAARTDHRVLGAHVAGDRATDIVQVVAGGMAGHCTVEDLASLELAYPTYSGIVRVAASRLAARLRGD